MKRTVLGLYLGDSLTQAVMLQLNGSSAELLALSEWPSRLFEFAGDDTPGIDELEDHLSAFLSQAADKPAHAAVALDSSMAFINTTPFPESATRDQILDHVRWELSQYHPDYSPRSFITDIHILPSKQQMHSEEVMSVGVRRERVEQVRKALLRVKLETAIVDVDHFSADVAMRRNYPDTAGKFIALFGVKALRVDASFIRYSDLDSYSYALPATASAVVAHVKAAIEGVKGLSHVLLYGADLTNEIIGGIRSASTLPVEIINPLRTIDIAARARTQSNYLQHPHRFAAAIGVALRRD